MKRVTLLLTSVLLGCLLGLSVAFADDGTDYDVFNSFLEVKVDDEVVTLVKNGTIDEKEGKRTLDNVSFSRPIKRDAKVVINCKTDGSFQFGYMNAVLNENGTFTNDIEYIFNVMPQYVWENDPYSNLTSYTLPLGNSIYEVGFMDEWYGDDICYMILNFKYGLEEQEAIDAIAALPEAENVKLSDESTIKAARVLYDGLAKWKTTEPADPDIQDKVTNYSKLVSCEAAIQTIKDEESAKETAKNNAGTAIAAAEALTASDYTDDSFNAVTDAKTALKAILAMDDATSKEIVEATNALYDAISKLVRKTPVAVKKKQPMTVKVVLKAVSFKALKKAKKVVKGALVVKKNQGTVTYKKLSGSKKLTINKTTGKITVKKGTKKGLYKIKVKVSAKGNAKYKAGYKTVTAKIRVK